MKWLPTYFLTLALAAFGTVNQGDDSPWLHSLFIYAPTGAAAILWILWQRGRSRDSLWLATGHVFTLYLAMAVLPGYWTRVTLTGDHIAAGFGRDYIGAFPAAPWHVLWAPVMTALVIALIVAIGRESRLFSSCAKHLGLR